MAKMVAKLLVAAYIRVSDNDQVDGYSLDAQVADIRRWCERQGYELIAIYREEGGSAHSDRIDRRPRLSALLQDAAAGRFDLVVVHTLDRWARNVGVQCQALQRLGDAHVGFASVMENIDYTTAPGKLMLAVMGGVSQFYSDQLAVHVSKAFRQKANLGLVVGPIPFGYTMGEAISGSLTLRELLQSLSCSSAEHRENRMGTSPGG